MIRGTTVPKQALPMLAAAALLLPAIIALAVWLSAQQGEHRRAVQRDAMDTARRMLALSDTELEANERVLAVIAGSPLLQNGEFADYTGRITRVVRDNPDWRALLVREAETGKVLVEIPGIAAEDLSAPLRPLPAAQSAGASVEGAFRDGRYCPCVIIDIPVAGARGQVMSLFLRPEPFQRIAMRNASKGAITAVVDKSGNFLARSRNFSTRVGTPGSRYVREAVAKGGFGFYRGTTLEGFENYTAYATSPDTGVSAHVAIAVGQIDSPRTLANASVLTAILAALVLAAGLMFYATFELRRRRIEEQRLIGMQKAEAISRFTGMLAHDSRNILAVIDAGVRLILRHTKEEETAQRARAIGEAVERGNRLINQLLSFVRGNAAEVRVLDLHKCLSACEDLLQRSLGDGIDFRWHVSEDARYALANGDQIELALLNLAINARDAMEGMGNFTLEVTRDDGMVAISAADDGPGIPPPVRSRIFETFYSTKGDGKGTGLGLAQVAGAARQAGGRVEMTDSASGGACFTIYLPRAEAGEMIA